MQQIPKTLDGRARLEELRTSAEEHALLNQIRTRLARVEAAYRADEELFDAGLRPIGDASQLAGDPERCARPAERLLRREETIASATCRT